jgi:phage-related holin
LSRELSIFASVTAKLFGNAAAGKWLAAFFAGVLTYFLPTSAQQSAALGAAHLIALDTVTGVVAARMSGKAIRSARFGRALVKLLAYGSVISVVAVAVNHVPGGVSVQGASVSSVLTLIIATEGISVLENVRAMGFQLPLGLDQWLEGRLAPPEGR